MNFIVENWYLIFLLVASASMLAMPALRGASAGVSIAQAVQHINREKAMVIDVCEPEEFAAGHVSGAKNVPLGQLQERLAQVAKNKTTPVILVCTKGARAQRAAGIARNLGYSKAHALTGGLAAWRQDNMPVEKS